MEQYASEDYRKLFQSIQSQIGANASESEKARLFTFMKALLPRSGDLTVVSEEIQGDTATLVVQYKKQRTTVLMVKEKDEWKLKQEHWNFDEDLEIGDADLDEDQDFETSGSGVVEKVNGVREVEISGGSLN